PWGRVGPWVFALEFPFFLPTPQNTTPKVVQLNHARSFRSVSRMRRLHARPLLFAADSARSWRLAKKKFVFDITAHLHTAHAGQRRSSRQQFWLIPEEQRCDLIQAPPPTLP